MQPSRFILVSGAATVLLSFGCGDSGTTSGTTTGATSTVSAAQTATTGTGTGGAYTCGQGGGGGAREAECMTTNFDPNCGPCLAAACCDATKAAMGDGSNPAVSACAKSCCLMDCYPPTQSDYTFECAPPSASSSNGSCVTLGGTVSCNPITNEGCNVAAGESCDRISDTVGNNTGFQCYPAVNGMGMMQNIHEVCQPCNDGLGYCKPGLSCFDACGKFCCSDADCSPGVCTRVDPKGNQIFPMFTSLGLCTAPP